MKKIYILACLVLTLLAIFVLSSCGDEENANNDQKPSGPCLDGMHEFSPWKVEKEAYCNELGLQTRYCLVCEVYSEEQEIKNTTNHEYENYVCVRCGHSISPIIENFTLSDDGTYYILSQLESLEVDEYDVPSIHNGKPVLEIGKDAFKGCEYVKKINIPKSIEKINDGAFTDCKSLVSMVIPDNVKYIGFGAFSGCFNLESLEIPFVGMNNTTQNAVIGYIFGSPKEGNPGILQTVGDKEKLFWISPKLVEVKVTGGQLYDYCFENCTNIKRVVYTGKGSVIGTKAFNSCVSLDSVSLPISISEFGERAFQHCVELDVFPLVEGIEKIGDFCFAGCKTDYTASTFEIPSTVTSIGEGAFKECNFIKTVIIPANVGRLPNYLFQNCKNLASVTLLDPYDSYKIKSIGRYCFSGCDKLVEFKFSNSVEEIRNFAFYGCHALVSVDIPASVEKISDEAFKNCSLLSQVTFAEGLETIGKKSFEKCPSLKSISFPASLKEIGDEAFLDCPNLKEFIVDEKNEVYASEDGNLYSAGKTNFILVAPAFEKEDLILPESVTSIEKDAFAYTRFIANLHLPASLRQIDEKTFYFNTCIKSVSFLGDIRIGDYAFAGCPNLEEVTLKGVDRIGTYAFSQCPKLKSVNMDDAANIMEGSFFKCPMLTDVIISNVELLAEHSFSDCVSLKNVDISNNVKVIGEGVFNNCTALEEITIGSGTEVIGDFAFQGCTSLKNVKIEEGLISIKDASFKSCTSLEEIYFPSTLQSIDAYAFDGCSSLSKFSISRNNTYYAVSREAYLMHLDMETEDIVLIIVAPGKIEEEMTIPDGITIIDKYVFRNASNLKRVYFPESLKVIKEEAFFNSGLEELDLAFVEHVEMHAFGQTKLTNVTLNESLKKLDEYAFQFCYDLENVYVRGSVEAIGFAIFHGVGTEEKKLNVFVDFERGNTPEEWNEGWLDGCVYDIDYEYVFEDSIVTE